MPSLDSSCEAGRSVRTRSFSWASSHPRSRTLPRIFLIGWSGFRARQRPDDALAVFFVIVSETAACPLDLRGFRDAVQRILRDLRRTAGAIPFPR
jgi:hypothetical protein